MVQNMGASSLYYIYHYDFVALQLGSMCLSTSGNDKHVETLTRNS